MISRTRGPLPAVAVLAVFGSALPAQQMPAGKAIVQGVVIDAGSRFPVEGATVRLRPVRGAADTTGPRTLTLRTGSDGAFRFAGLRTGSYLLAALYGEYTSPLEQIFLGANDRLEVEFAVGEPGVMLPELTVEAKAEPKRAPFLQAFYERAERGLGDYLLRADLQPFSGMSLWNALRTAAGVRVICGGTGSCRAYSVQGNPSACPGGAAVIIDGHPAPVEQLGRTSPQEVEGIEIYGGTSTAPLEYMRSNPACGTIIVWTRRGP